MKPLKKISLLFLGLFLLLGLPAWEVSEERPLGWGAPPPGTIEAIAFAGAEQVFTFERWQFTQFELPEDDFSRIRLEAEIDTRSLSCSWKELERNIKKKKDYFYVKKFPKAWVRITGAQVQDDGSYLCDAELDLKGVKKNVELAFTVSDQKPYRVQGSSELKRRKFKFNGNGPKNEVNIRFDIVLPEGEKEGLMD